MAESRPEETRQADSANVRAEDNQQHQDARSTPSDQSANSPTDETELVHPEPKRRKRFIIIGAIVLVVIGVALYWWHSTYYEDTDDAQVDGNLVQISARIKGYISQVNVQDNSQVEKGQVLVEIDPRDAQAALTRQRRCWRRPRKEIIVGARDQRAN